MGQENRISTKFAELAKRGECGLICYIVAGYPDMRTSEAVAEKLVEAGADMIEIGIPFSDPIADGPTIQAASHSALENGVTPGQALSLASRLRKRYPALPLLVMTYSNILARRGFERFVSESKRSGIDGFIIPDMPVEEAEEYITTASRHGLSTVFLAAPNTAPDRLREIISASTGFLYLVSVFGITGARSTFENYTLRSLAEVKQAASDKIPVAVGFGISKPKHVRLMKSVGADAVIVGSALVNIMDRLPNQRAVVLRRVTEYVRSMKVACKKHTKTH